MIRRIVAPLLGFAMLHLSVVRVNARCTMHDHDAQAADHAGMQHHGGAPAKQAPCENPASHDCSHALASCGPMLTIAQGVESVLSPAIAHVTIAAAVSERPLSRSVAPEPPPPKT